MRHSSACAVNNLDHSETGVNAVQPSSICIGMLLVVCGRLKKGYCKVCSATKRKNKLRSVINC